MGTRVVEIPRPVEKGRVPILHRYPFDPRYRLSGMSLPQIGDIARCGWRKNNPPCRPCPPGIACVVCEELERS